MNSISITTIATVNNSQEKVFNYVVPIPLNQIFQKYKFLPGVTGTDEKEKWITAGLTRTVFTDDGNTAYEELLTVTPNSYFSYRISKFTSALRFLISCVNGSWVFESKGSQTYIIWEYELIPHNDFTNWIINTFLKKVISQYLQNAMDIIVTDLNSKN
jgi:Polyketide cyclase / dehydrase and lipid transport